MIYHRELTEKVGDTGKGGRTTNLSSCRNGTKAKTELACQRYLT